MVLSSSSIKVNLVFEANSLSIISSIQYLVSEASLRAIVYFDKKSLRDCANSASAQFALISSTTYTMYTVTKIDVVNDFYNVIKIAHINL